MESCVSREKDCLDLTERRGLDPPIIWGVDLVGDYEGLLDACPRMRELDNIADALGKGRLPFTDVVAELSRIVGPASGRFGWLGSVQALVVAQAGLLRTAFERAACDRRRLWRLREVAA